jgi:16S rRNA (uracil1498-N3)-methyltransferase
MTPRLYLDVELTVGAKLVLPEAAAHHIAKVLRLLVGSGLVLFNGQGGEYSARILRCAKTAVEVEVLEFLPVDRESSLSIVLAQGISKGERMDYTIQKAVELGVQRIVPLLTARTVVNLDEERAAKRLQHWQRIAISACEQCGRTRLPEFDRIYRLDRWLGSDLASLRLVCAPATGRRLSEITTPTDSICLLIGPEGGLDESEIAAAERAGYLAIRLGPRILRTETAPLAAIAALQTLWGDLG